VALNGAWGTGPARTAALLCAAALVACAARRPPSPAAPPPPPTAYRAHLQVTVEALGRGFSLPSGAAVDPARGGRVELRDALGGARLLLLLDSASGRLFRPGTAEEARWTGACEALPWSPSDLWSLLVASPPTAAHAVRRDGSGRPLSAAWPGAGGTLRVRFTWEPGRLFPPAEAHLKGPGAARLAVVWRDAQAGGIPDGALDAPQGGGAVVPLEDLLAEVSR